MTKAKRQTIALGDLELDVFQLPDGGYVMSQTQVAEAVALTQQYAQRFLSSKWLKALPGESYTEHDFSRIEVESSGQLRGQSRISPIPIEVAALFWIYQVWQKNRQAIALVVACVNETLARRADAAFGIARSEAEYEAATSEMMRLLGRVARERDILTDSYAIDDAARELADEAWRVVELRDRRIEKLENQIRELGGDPDD